MRLLNRSIFSMRSLFLGKNVGETRVPHSVFPTKHPEISHEHSLPLLVSAGSSSEQVHTWLAMNSTATKPCGPYRRPPCLHLPLPQLAMVKKGLLSGKQVHPLSFADEMMS